MEGEITSPRSESLHIFTGINQNLRRINLSEGSKKSNGDEKILKFVMV